MVIMLYNFGYFFWIEKYYSEKVEDKILDFLITWENRKMSNKEITMSDIINKIKMWIYSNITISINFKN
jgi:hypothetical protein